MKGATPMKHKMKFSPSPGRLLSLLTFLGLMASPALRAAPEFLYLGDLPGGSDYSLAMGVSADGTYIVGGSSSTNSGPVFWYDQPTEAFVWDKTRGMVALGDLPGGNFVSLAHAVTSNGNVVVGTSEENRASSWGGRRAP